MMTKSKIIARSHKVKTFSDCEKTIQILEGDLILKNVIPSNSNYTKEKMAMVVNVSYKALISYLENQVAIDSMISKQLGMIIDDLSKKNEGWASFMTGPSKEVVECVFTLSAIAENLQIKARRDLNFLKGLKND